jgi:alkaline phosphatase D
MRLLLSALLILAGIASAPAGQPNLVSKILFGSCADQNKPLPIFGPMAEQKADLLILLGDNMYADIEDGRLKPANPEKIAKCYSDLAAMPGWQKLKSSTGKILATWDDHDYGHNDAGVEWPHKDVAQKMFHDFFGTPENDPRRTRQGVYHAETFGPAGKRVQVIMLDTRYHRTKLVRAERPLPGTRIVPYLPVTDSEASVLGAEQWKWFEEQLRQPADVRIIGSSIQLVTDDHPFEKWANMPKERDRFFKLIRDTGAGGVIVLSGDRHLGELSMLPAEIAGYPLYDITSSGFNQASKDWRAAEPNKHRVAAMPYGDNFGLITINWESTDPEVSLQLRDVNGDVVIRHAVPIAKLQGQEKPKDKPKIPLPEGVITAEEAIKKVGMEVTVQMEVAAGRAVSGGKRILLNSEKDFRSDKNLTVVLNEKGMTGKWEKATYDTFKSKTIRVKGKVTLYQDKPQIEVNEEKVLEIVEAKKEDKK